MADPTALPEEWRPVVGWEGFYEVSHQGRLRSVDRIVECGPDRHQRRYRGMLLNRGRRSNTGHISVVLYGPGRRANRWMHQLVLEAFVGPRPPGMWACHGNDIAWDNRVGNLRWDTPGENIRDAVRNGRNGMANRAECPRGHLLAAPNLVPSSLRQGRRSCLACSKASGRINYYKRTGRVVGDLRAVSDAYYVEIMEERAA
jgi:hypothetical protein